MRICEVEKSEIKESEVKESEGDHAETPSQDAVSPTGKGK
jgi:hypothetical protein